ncbi:hypothetical protein FQN57_001318 [Myotisia sp. PD_48]|nr:hypothetical protein FQN57_001318 [Myotisia sp. PD_48]
MTTPLGDGAMVGGKPQPKSLPSLNQESSYNPDLKRASTPLDSKSPSIRPSLDMAEADANQLAVDANGSLSPKLNGHSAASPSLLNGITSLTQDKNPSENPSSNVQETQVTEQPALVMDTSSPTLQHGPPETMTTSAVESGTAALQLGSADDNDEKMTEASPIAKENPTPNIKTDKPDATDGNNSGPGEREPKEVEMTSPGDETRSEQAEEFQNPVTTKVSPAVQPIESNPDTSLGAEQPTVAKSPSPLPAPVSSHHLEDHEMTDAPGVLATKISREREEEPNEEPVAKRAKTDEVSTGDQSFGSSTLPTTSAAANGLPDTSKPLTKLQAKFLSRCLQALKRTSDARFFKTPVDPVKLNIPTYLQIIKQPMDLQKMEATLKSQQYSTVDEFVRDFNLMVENSLTFNGPDHIVTIEGKKLQQSFERHLSKLPSPDEVEPTAAEKRSKKAATVPTKSQPPRRESRPMASSRAANAASPTFALGPEGLPLIRRDSTAIDGRPKRSIHPPKNRELPYPIKPKKKKYQWELKFCQETLDEMQKAKYYPFVSPFYLPVDPVALNIPTYHNVIKKPMDLQTMSNKLQTGQYENAKEFEMDMRQIFKNCYKFNIVGDPTYTAGKRAEETFDNKWSQKSRWLEAHEPSSGHQSVGTSDNESDEDEDDSDGIEEEKLTQLQKQIAEMSRQVEAITQKKKKTPPVSKKAAKPKAGKKESKKASGPAKKERKGTTKSTKPEKQRWITYREKQIISHGIAGLPDKKMSEALRIIQQNVPSLNQGSNDTEIELDIDELPNDVLALLLKFVKKHAPQTMDFEEPAPMDPTPSAVQSKPKKSKPMNKVEQEAQIRSLQSNLSKFKGAAGNSSDPAQEAESSDDDEESEESEEE